MVRGPLTDMLTAVLTTAALVYLTRRALRSRPVSAPDGRLVLQYPAVLRVGGTLMSIGLAVLGASCPFWGGTNPHSSVDTVIIWLAGTFIGGLGVYGALEFSLVRIDIREDGLLGRSPWGPSRYVPWDAVESVRFSSGPQWFVIRSTDGNVIRAHLYLSGVRDLYDALQQHVPTSAWRSRYAPFEERARRGAGTVPPPTT